MHLQRQQPSIPLLTQDNFAAVTLPDHVAIVIRNDRWRLDSKTPRYPLYPTMPFATTGDWGLVAPGVIDPAKKDGHMRYAGSVNLAEETFGAVAHDVALSAISAGFKNVVLMCDHGGKAQSQLEKVAEKMDKEWAPKGIHVYYIPDLYYKEKDMMKEYLPKHGLPVDLHAGTDDTSEVLYVVYRRQGIFCGTPN